MIPNTYIREIVAATKTSAEVRIDAKADAVAVLAESITDAQISTLRAEAVQAGDLEMVLRCRLALGEASEFLTDMTTTEARAQCAEVIAAASAMAQK